MRTRRRFEWAGAADHRRRDARLVRRGWRTAGRRQRDRRPVVARGRRRRAAGADQRASTRPTAADRAAGRPCDDADGALAELDAGAARGARARRRQHPRRRRGPARRGDRGSSCPRARPSTVREVPVGAAGIYAPGGRAAYSVERPDGCDPRPGRRRRAASSSLARPAPTAACTRSILAAAALCGVDEIYAVGGAQAIFALAYGTETIAAGRRDRRPRQRLGPGGQAGRLRRGRDRLAGRALRADGDRRRGHRPRVGRARPLRPGRARRRQPAGGRRGRGARSSTRSRRRPSAPPPSARASPTRRWRWSTSPTSSDAVDLANAFAPEHLELLRGATRRCSPSGSRTAGCVFVGRNGATAFGDYVAGSNHVLPTGGAGRFSGPLGPGAFRRRIAHGGDRRRGAAAALAPHVDALARAEGLPVHGESAMIRTSDERADREQRAQDGGDPDRARSSTSTAASTRARRPGSASSTTCSTCSRATAASASGRGRRRPRDRRPPHGRGRRHRARPGARRGARRPRRDPPLRLGRGADGRGRWPSARSTSPAARSVVFDADLPTTSIAGFDTELAEEFFRAVANSAEADPARRRPLRHRTPTT